MRLLVHGYYISGKVSFNDLDTAVMWCLINHCVQIYIIYKVLNYLKADRRI